MKKNSKNKKTKNKSAKDVNVKVEYLTRVEGHGNIHVTVKDGKLTDCRFAVVESPRLFESMVVGRSIFETQHITSRICGICACGHSLASIKAGEDALGITPSEQTMQLRDLLMFSEQMDSHVLHFYVLVAPDLLGVDSIFPLVKTHRPVIEMALRMKKVSDHAGTILAGRHTHPISYVIGGVTKIITKAQIDELLSMMKAARKDFDETLKVFTTLSLPDFHRDTQFVSLKNKDTYAFLRGDIYVSSTEKHTPCKDYLDVINEFIVDYSSAKFSQTNGRSYAAGALARFNNNFDQLHPKAKEAAKKLGLKQGCDNIYMNTIAQVVEWIHCLEHSIKILENFKKNGINPDDSLVTSWPTKKNRPFKTKPNRGVGIVEVPRGILVHDYTVDENGMVTKANCVIPTNQNVNNLEQDMKKLVPELIGNLSEDDIRLRLEMLARAYDPCISCSCHLLDVEFK